MITNRISYFNANSELRYNPMMMFGSGTNNVSELGTPLNPLLFVHVPFCYGFPFISSHPVTKMITPTSHNSLLQAAITIIIIVALPA